MFESVEMLEKLKRLRKEAFDTGKIKFRKETGIDFDHDGVIQLEGTLEQKIKELNDWRPISLLLTMYKVFMKIIQRKIIPWIVSEKRLCATQKGSLPRNGLQEHVFSIRAIIEDFKNSSGKLYVHFMDITDTFGSISHDLMTSELRDAGYPEWLCSLTKEIYTGSQ